MEEPVKTLAKAAIEGAQAVVSRCQSELEKCIAAGNKIAIDTPFPIYYGLTGKKVEKVSDLEEAFEHVYKLLPKTTVKDSLWLPYLGDALNAGMATILASEIMEALKTERGQCFQIDEGFIGKVRRLLNENKIRGLVAVAGSAPSYEKAQELISSLVGERLLAFFVGVSGQSIALQAKKEIIFSEESDRFLIHLSEELSGLVHFIELLVNLALLEKEVNPGESYRLLSFVKENYFAFQIMLGELTPLKAAYITGAISFGVHTVGQVYIPQLLPIHSLP